MFFGIDIDVIPDKTYNSITPEKLGISPKNFPNYDLLRDVVLGKYCINEFVPLPKDFFGRQGMTTKRSGATLQEE